MVASGIHSAALLPHKLSMWQPLRENIAVGYCSFIIACPLLYLPDMFAVLSLPCALQLASGITWLLSASVIV